jgi:hypothetical protein
MLDRGEYGAFFPMHASGSGAVFSPVRFLLGVTNEEFQRFGAPMLDPKRGNVVTGEREADAKPAMVSAIPDSIDDVDPGMLVKKPILDAELGRNYSVLPQDYERYKSRRLPFPRQHFTTRLKALVNLVNKPVYRDETCNACKKSLRVAMNTAFPDRKILCQDCYLKHLEQYG